MATTLIETVRIRNGVAPLWYLHLRRMAASCRALGVPIPVELAVPSGGTDRVHRILVSRRGVVVGERPVGSTAPVRLVTSKVGHRPYPHKVVDREQFDRAVAEARAAGADDGVMLTPGRQVTETAIWGIFWWEDGVLCAPALELGVLPGVGRARLAELVGEVAERRPVIEELQGRSLFVANSVRGVVPVASLDGQEVPEQGETAALAAKFWP
ncbi:MAG TPA: aminotransferase class IV [Gemmatimonadales bacterium]|jgi:branched-chain amino acid aminotransferase/4-amino-4-deoxychorismate lyase